MSLTGYAYFVSRPRVFADLFRPHLIEEERPYRIVKTVTLPAIDYENFITDLLVDRPFIEAFLPLCTAPGDCLLIRPCFPLGGKSPVRTLGDRGLVPDGILVIPGDGSFVASAAYYRP